MSLLVFWFLRLGSWDQMFSCSLSWCSGSRTVIHHLGALSGGSAHCTAAVVNYHKRVPHRRTHAERGTPALIFAPDARFMLGQQLEASMLLPLLAFFDAVHEMGHSFEPSLSFPASMALLLLILLLSRSAQFFLQRFFFFWRPSAFVIRFSLLWTAASAKILPTDSSAMFSMERI